MNHFCMNKNAFGNQQPQLRENREAKALFSKKPGIRFAIFPGKTSQVFFFPFSPLSLLHLRSATQAMWSEGKTMLGMAVCAHSSSSDGNGITSFTSKLKKGGMIFPF